MKQKFYQLLMAVMACAFAYGQNETLAISEIVPLDSNYNKDQLYEAAKRWVLKKYQSANTVIQADSKEEGKLVLRARSDVHVKFTIATGTAGSGRKECWYTLFLEFKDGRWKYTFDNIGYRNDPLSKEPRKGLMSKSEKPYREACMKHIEELAAELKKAIATKSEDW